MIIEIPTASDFVDSGRSLLNLAWDAVSTLYLDLENSDVKGWDDDGEVTDEFWEAAQRPLANAVAIAQQGVEFLLKAKSAEVSPFLLLGGSPRDWPSGCQERDVSFSEFRTIEAQDLPKVHDAVRRERLAPGFRDRFGEFRLLRNSIMHTVDKRLRHSGRELWLQILEASHELTSPHDWFAVRRPYLKSTPSAIVFSLDEDHSGWQLCWEADRLLQLLKPAEAKLFLGVSVRQRFYSCFNCADTCRDSELELRNRSAPTQQAPTRPASIVSFAAPRRP